jgi:hypothetical protein
VSTIKRVCISAAAPETYGLAGFSLGEFTNRDGFGNTKTTYQGEAALAFGAEFDALVTWNPMHVSVVRDLRVRRPGIRLGVALAVEAITASPHPGETTLNMLRDSLLPVAYNPPVDYYEGAQPPFPQKPHAMAIDFEHRPDEVLAAVKTFLEHLRRYEFDLIFFDTLIGRRYWGAATNAPQVADGPYEQCWREIVQWTLAHVAPVWGHTGTVETYPNAYRVVEHFYREADPATRAAIVDNMLAAGRVLVREGEWNDVKRVGLDTVRAELKSDAQTADAWIVNARSGSAFGLFTV